jgi:8-oxo-dGTP diphosphatase
LRVDSIVTKLINQDQHVLLITRGKPPYQGIYAFPGSFVDYGEDPEDACLRKLKEEFCIQGFKL